MFSGGFGAVGVEDLGLPAISGGAGWLLSVWRSWVVAERRLELSAIWFPASRAFGDLVPGELGGRQVLWWLSAGSVHSWSVPGDLWWFPADLCRLGVFPAFCGAIGEIGCRRFGAVGRFCCGCRRFGAVRRFWCGCR
jgi:hypothetical protein